MKPRKACVRAFGGYRHSKYDSYYCSWGILSALEVESFNDGSEPSEYFDKNFRKGNITFDDVLFSLDVPKEEIEKIFSIKDGESLVINEYLANSPWPIRFENKSGVILATSPKGEVRICENFYKLNELL